MNVYSLSITIVAAVRTDRSEETDSSESVNISLNVSYCGLLPSVPNSRWNLSKRHWIMLIEASMDQVNYIREKERYGRIIRHSDDKYRST